MHEPEMPRETAEVESEITLLQVIQAIRNRQNFRLEAGAGAGKTYTLIKALQYVLDNRETCLSRPDQRVACLTYTNVARDEIVRRTDQDPSVFADTLHGFLWEMIQPYKKMLKQLILKESSWIPLATEDSAINDAEIRYDMGIRKLEDGIASLHHDDVPNLAIALFKMPKFRMLISDRFPIFFIDEYQDTPAGLAEAMLGDNDGDRSPVFGFFGDHWQRIYDDSCGLIEHTSVEPIPKNANFRSSRSIVEFLNKLRTDLPQAPAIEAGQGSVTVLHTNEWPGERLHRHLSGQISLAASRNTLLWTEKYAREHRWHGEGGSQTKKLLLTHAAIANELGYAKLAEAFRFNDSFAKKGNSAIAYFVEIIEPARLAFNERRYGELLNVLNRAHPRLKSIKDKMAWSDFFRTLETAAHSGTVGDVLDVIFSQSLFSVPTAVRRVHERFKNLTQATKPGDTETLPRSILEYQNLRNVPYAEVSALTGYLNDQTTFSTKHGVKGAEFDNVIAVLGRGWARYNFGKMLSDHPASASLTGRDWASYERTRNLFYVAVSRAKQNLVLLFTQELDVLAVEMLVELAGPGNVFSVIYQDDMTPTGVRPMESPC